MGKEYRVKSIFCVQNANNSYEYFATYNEAELYAKTEPTHKSISAKQVLENNGSLYLFDEDLSSQLNRNIAAKTYYNDMWPSASYDTAIATEVFIKYGDSTGDYCPWKSYMTDQTQPILTLVSNRRAIPIKEGKNITLNLSFQQPASALVTNETYQAYNIFSVTVEKKKSKFFAGTTTDFFCTLNEATLFIKKQNVPAGSNHPYPQKTIVIKKDGALFAVEKGSEIQNIRNKIVEKDQIARVYAEIDSDGDIRGYSLTPENCNITPIYVYNMDYKVYRCNVFDEEPITINASLMLEVETELRAEYEKKIQEAIQQHIDMMDKLKLDEPQEEKEISMKAKK